MSRTLPDLFGRASSVSADHAHLRTVWTRLRKVLALKATDDGPPPEEQWRSIREFASEVTAHFAAEEADSHFGALMKHRQDLRLQIARLREEHAQITVLINELLAAQGTAKPADLDAMLRSLLEYFQQHEHAEAALLQDYFARDAES